MPSRLPKKRCSVNVNLSKGVPLGFKYDQSIIVEPTKKFIPEASDWAEYIRIIRVSLYLWEFPVSIVNDTDFADNKPRIEKMKQTPDRNTTIKCIEGDIWDIFIECNITTNSIDTNDSFYLATSFSRSVLGTGCHI